LGKLERGKAALADDYLMLVLNIPGKEKREKTGGAH
jgi:hypothetical protein